MSLFFKEFAGLSVEILKDPFHGYFCMWQNYLQTKIVIFYRLFVSNEWYIMARDVAKEGWKDFLQLCSKIRSVEEFNQLFDLFLTIEEKETLASRYLIIKALLEGNLTQREIAEIYKVSIAQITRGSNALKIISPELRHLLKARLK